MSERPFLAAEGLFDAAQVADAPQVLARGFDGALGELSQRAPDAKLSSRSSAEQLTKTGRLLSSPVDGEQLDDATGLGTMLRSASFRGFVQVLCGRALTGPKVTQVLCYRPGDYAGPHTDHRPEAPRARDGYTDVHLTFCEGGVTRQLLVYERDGHLSGVADVSVSGLLTVYRLPFWHYTTPLEGPAAARRWVVMGSFLDAAAA